MERTEGQKAAQAEAIAQADAYLSNAGLPTYSALLKAVQHIDSIKGSTGGNASLVAEFKNTARLALAA